MPVPLNAFVEISRCWLSKKLGYHTDVSIPVKPSIESGIKVRTPSDIDIVCTHPKSDNISVSFEPDYKLSKNLLVECKGLISSSTGSYDIVTGLAHGLNIMNENRFIPKTVPVVDKRLGYFLREEFVEKGREIFGSNNFDRVLIGPKLNEKHGNIKKENIIKKLKEKDILVLEMNYIIMDLIEYLQKPEAKDYLRKDFILELLHLTFVYNNKC